MAKTTIHSDYIPDNAITSTKIAENSIGAREIATNAITTLYVADGSVTTVKIADDAITSAKLDTNIDIAGTLGVTGNITGTLATAAQTNITSVGTLTGLDVAGTPTFDGLTVSATTATINITGGSSGASLINFGDSDDGNVGRIYYDHTDNFMQFKAADGERLRINSTGIDVTGTVVADGLTVEGDTLSMSHTGNTSTISLTQKAGTQNSIATILANREDTSTSASRLVFSTNDGTSTLQRMRIGNGGDISFYEDTGTTAKFFWDASAESLGIGTSSPSSVLEVTGTGDADTGILTTHSRSGVGYTLRLNNTNNGANKGSGVKWSSGGFNTGAIIVRSDAVAASGDAPAYMTFHTSADGTEGVNERMRIDSAGNVGIGTDNPSSALHVTSTTANTNGVVRFQNNMDNNYETLRIESLGDYDAHIGFFADGSSNYYWGAGVDYSDSGKFKIANDNLLAVNTRLTIDSSGNVGIGTSSPTEKLDINGGAVIKGSLTNGAGTGSALRMQHSSNISEILSLEPGVAWRELRTNASQQTFYIAGGERMRIDSSGNVGIGTTSPQQKLVVSDGGGYGFEFAPNLSSVNHILSYDRSGGAYRDFKISANEIRLGYGQAAANEAMRIDSSGNVKIGTTNTNHDAKFNLAGTGDNAQQVYMQHNEIYVVGQLSGSAGVSTKTATIVFETNHLRACTIEMETSGHKYNNGADFWHTRHFYSCMSEGSNTRINNRISNHEFEEGGTNRMTTSLTKISGSNLWSAVITINGEYQCNYHFRLQGYGAVNPITSLSTT